MAPVRPKGEYAAAAAAAALRRKQQHFDDVTEGYTVSIKELFNKLDVDTNGKLDKQELRGVITFGSDTTMGLAEFRSHIARIAIAHSDDSVEAAREALPGVLEELSSKHDSAIRTKQSLISTAETSMAG